MIPTGLTYANPDSEKTVPGWVWNDLLAEATQRNYIEYRRGNPNLLAFGRTFTTSIDGKIIDDVTNDLIWKNFYDTRNLRFPTWPGKPEIVEGPQIDWLRRYRSVGWYVEVPKEYVVDSLFLDNQTLRRQVETLEKHLSDTRQMVEDALKALGVDKGDDH
jgi:hypothetical protein